MIKKYKKDLLNLLILIGIFFVVYFAITRFSFLFGSTKDWGQQHYLIPEYFRNLFYSTKDLIPDFAFNMGGGQNIYNFAYYGFLNPIILVSYLFPFIPMKLYIIWSTIFMILLSVILMYIFIRRRSSSKISFISTFMFLMAMPLIYHAHRHIMFINYMPFLIMGYFGVEKYFEKRNVWLLSLSVFLMIMTSYFFSVGGIVSLIIYGIYCYIKINDKITFKKFIGDGIKFLIPILVGVLMSSILIVPTFYSLLNGRSGDNEGINLIRLLVPNLRLKNVLYSTYSLGLSSLSLFSLIYCLFEKKKEKFISIIMIIFSCFPILIALLNGFLYVDSKVFITFIPLFIIIINTTLKDFEKGLINHKKVTYLFVFGCSLSMLFVEFDLFSILLIEGLGMLVFTYLANKNKTLNYLYFLMPVILIMCIAFNLGDGLVKRNLFNDNKELVDKVVESDKDFYRINVYDNELDSVNNIYNIKYYNSSIYSSSSNKYLKDFYYNQVNNEVIFRSYGMLSNPNNIFYNIYMGNKYVISHNYDSSLYEEVDKNIYKNEDVFTLGYSTNKLMGTSYYNSLSYPDKLLAYLNYIIVDSDISPEFKTNFRKVDLDYELLGTNVDFKYNKDKSKVTFKIDDDKGYLKLGINNNLVDKTLVIRFKMNYQELCSVRDTYITINGVKNKLTCKEWKYQNKNDYFEYVLSNKDLTELDIRFSKGTFDVSDFEVYSISNRHIRKLNDSIDKFIVDNEKTKGDKIVGNILVNKDGYFNLTIPYDNGFRVLVDGREVSYEKTNIDFIGFKIGEGYHDIEIEYHSPFKNIGVILSLIGLVLFFIEGFIWVILEMKDPHTKLFKFCMGIYNKNKEVFNYLIVGCLTTVVSLGSKWLVLFTVLDASDAFELQVAIIFSWICAVLFAYFANRIFVFNSKNKNILKEMVSFFGARVLTLVMEMVIMWFFVTLLCLNTDLWVFIWTFVTQVLIMFFNYIFSKLFVFKKK